MGSSGGGGNLDKMAKNCMKITKSSLLGQNSWGTSQFWGYTFFFYKHNNYKHIEAEISEKSKHIVSIF